MATNDYLTVYVHSRANEHDPNGTEKGEDVSLDVLTAWLPLAAFAIPVPGGFVLYPEPDARTPERGDFLAHYISRRIDGAVLLSEVRDDVLRLRFFLNGVTVDEYVAETPESDAPTGGDAPALLAAFGAPVSDSEFLAPLLRAARFDDDYGYGAATDRHAEIADLLGVPAIAGIGYEQITQGRLPEGVTQSDLRQITGTDSRLWQFALLRVPDGTSETETASYLLPDMVSLERGIETDDWVSNFGTLAEVRGAIAHAANVAAPSGNGWLEARADAAVLHFDFGYRQDSDSVEIVRVFLTAQPGAKQSALPYLAHIAQVIGASVWDWKTRRVLPAMP